MKWEGMSAQASPYPPSVPWKFIPVCMMGPQEGGGNVVHTPPKLPLASREWLAQRGRLCESRRFVLVASGHRIGTLQCAEESQHSEGAGCGLAISFCAGLTGRHSD